MREDPERAHALLLCAAGALSLLIATAALVLLLLSRSEPWRVGVQNEPHWSWAVGSGRLKVWVAEPGVPRPDNWWTSSCYRGLDGEPIRWDFTFSRGSTGGVIVVAIPLWFVSSVFGLLGGCFWWLARQERFAGGGCLRDPSNTPLQPTSDGRAEGECGSMGCAARG
jgi:hypothetical protein